MAYAPPEIFHLTYTEDVELFDRIARHELDISDEEFLRKYHNGDYDNIEIDDVEGLGEKTDGLQYK